MRLDFLKILLSSEQMYEKQVPHVWSAVIQSDMHREPLQDLYLWVTASAPVHWTLPLVLDHRSKEHYMRRKVNNLSNRYYGLMSKKTVYISTLWKNYASHYIYEYIYSTVQHYIWHNLDLILLIPWNQIWFLWLSIPNLHMQHVQSNSCQ